MKVEQNGKTLYHIQNTVMGSDGVPFDAFVWCDHFPTTEDFEKAFDLEYPSDGFDDEGRANMKEEWLTSSECYIVYAEDL